MDRSETGGMSSGVGQVSATTAGSQHSEDTTEEEVNEKGTEKSDLSILSKATGLLFKFWKTGCNLVCPFDVGVVNVLFKPAQEFELVHREEDDARSRRILLIGTAGRGKSATGNSILGREKFIVSDGSLPTPDSLVTEDDTLFGRLITVHDGLSFPEKQMTIPELRTLLQGSLKEIFKKYNDGFDCLVFVVSYNCRITQEEQVAAETIKKMLGDLSSDHFVLIFTHGESFDLHQTKGGGKSFEEWRQDVQCPIARELVRNFGDKVLLFYNESEKNENDNSDDGTNESKMVSSRKKFHNLLEKIPGRIRLKSPAGDNHVELLNVCQ